MEKTIEIEVKEDTVIPGMGITLEKGDKIIYKEAESVSDYNKH